jgi:hypothetical protein
VRDRDCLNDRQAQPKPIVDSTGTRRLATPLKRLERSIDVRWRNDRPAVRHEEHDVAVRRASAHLDVSCQPIVADGVVHEVGNHAFHQSRIAGDRGAIERHVQMQAPPRDLRLDGQEHLLGDARHVERYSSLESNLALCQCEQRVDQPPLLMIGDEHALVHRA